MFFNWKKELATSTEVSYANLKLATSARERDPSSLPWPHISTFLIDFNFSSPGLEDTTLSHINYVIPKQIWSEKRLLQY